MRNIKTREGYEFWDKICAVQSYAFLLSPDGRRVVKTPDIGDWIDKHDAQVIVDHAQEDFNELREQHAAAQSELAALREELDKAKREIVVLAELDSETLDLVEKRLKVAEQRNSELVSAMEMMADNSDDVDVVKICRHHIASNKPTKSGASECTPAKES